MWDASFEIYLSHKVKDRIGEKAGDTIKCIQVRPEWDGVSHDLPRKLRSLAYQIEKAIKKHGRNNIVIRTNT